MTDYPKVKDIKLVGEYSGVVKSGGGYVWDDVLEYRVWCHSNDGDDEDGDFYYAFGTFEEAFEFSQNNQNSEEPLALVLQEEYIDESEEGKYVHIKEQRLTEWPVDFLKRPRRTDKTIPNFLSPNAPPNRLEILRGLA